MADIEARISLQLSRFNLIQEAADYDYDHNPRSNRQLINARLDILEQNWAKFQQEHENLCLFESDVVKDHSYLKERIYEICQAFYVYARAQLHALRDASEAPTTRSNLSEQDASSSLRPRSSLPRIKLPVFSGNYQSWRSFHDLFTALIRDNVDLTNVEKMHYLKTCVTDEAARLVGNLTISDDNFTIAWTQLVSRYEN